MRLRMVGLALALSVASLAPATAQTLRMGVGAQVTSIDPHFHNTSNNNAFAATIFDSLIETDSSARLVPALAESWRPIENDYWEFKLRAGVKFHDGTPFTAQDVAFTFARVPTVPNSPGLFSTYLQSIKSVEVVDPLTLRVRTLGPDPLLPVNLAQVPILSHTIHKGAATEDFNSGKLAVGTGPFRVLSIKFGDRVELERNADYWGKKSVWARVEYRAITSDATRTAALLAGDVDIIDQVPTGDVEKLRSNARLRISEVDSLRLVFLSTDHSRDGPTPFVLSHDGKPLDRNPLKDLRVRQALDIAIDRDAIVTHVMEGVAAPTNQMIPKGAFGHVPDLVPPKVDRDKAKKLLEEAGYPQGFRLTLHAPNDRYPNDAKIAQAVGQMWTRIGVRTAVEVSPYTAYIGKATRQEFSAFFGSVGNSTGEPSSSLRLILHTFDRQRGLGAANRSRYSNPAFDAKLQAAMQELDDAKREAMLQDATRMVIADLGLISTHHQRNVWAMQRAFTHEARNDERTRPQDVRPAQ